MNVQISGERKKKIESELGCGVEKGENMQPNLNHAERKDGQFEKRTEDNKMSDYICSKRNSRRMNVGGDKKCSEK